MSVTTLAAITECFARMSGTNGPENLERDLCSFGFDRTNYTKEREQSSLVSAEHSYQKQEDAQTAFLEHYCDIRRIRQENMFPTSYGRM